MHRILQTWFVRHTGTAVLILVSGGAANGVLADNQKKSLSVEALRAEAAQAFATKQYAVAIPRFRELLKAHGLDELTPPAEPKALWSKDLSDVFFMMGESYRELAANCKTAPCRDDCLKRGLTAFNHHAQQLDVAFQIDLGRIKVDPEDEEAVRTDGPGYDFDVAPARFVDVLLFCLEASGRSRERLQEEAPDLYSRFHSFAVRYAPDHGAPRIVALPRSASYATAGLDVGVAQDHGWKWLHQNLEAYPGWPLKIDIVTCPSGATEVVAKWDLSSDLSKNRQPSWSVTRLALEGDTLRLIGEMLLPESICH